jgi:predicted phage terminase large subunit-like protein
MLASTVSQLARTVLAQRYDNPRPTPEFHEELWELCCLDHDKVAVGAPRGHAKTTAVTGSYTIAKIVFREADHVLIISDTEEQASEFLSEIKLEFIENEDFIEMFGVKRLVKDAATEVIIEFTDGHRCRLLAKGAEQRIRGRKWRGKRPNLIIIDDLENEELTNSDDRREKLSKWFYGSVLPAGGDDCIYRIVGTVMHFDSLLENLMPDENNKHTVTEDLRKYNMHQPWVACKYKAHTPEFEKVLWKEKFPEERLRKIRADYTRKGEGDIYAQEYLNEPLSTDNAYFEPRDFRSIPEDLNKRYEEKTDGYPTYIAGDLAISKSKKAAYTVLTVGKMSPDGILDIVDQVRGRWNSLEIIEQLFALNRLWSPEETFLEAENIQRTMEPVIYREMKDKSFYFTFTGETPVADKTARARPLQARMKAGQVRYNKNAEWYLDHELELRQFPKSPFKDQVDAAALLASKIDTMSDPLTADEEYEEQYEEDFGDFDMGRDMITGY